jgi:hypothetical protein
VCGNRSRGPCVPPAKHVVGRDVAKRPNHALHATQ